MCSNSINLTASIISFTREYRPRCIVREAMPLNIRSSVRYQLQSLQFMQGINSLHKLRPKFRPSCLNLRTLHRAPIIGELHEKLHSIRLWFYYSLCFVQNLFNLRYRCALILMFMVIKCLDCILLITHRSQKYKSCKHK